MSILLRPNLPIAKTPHPNQLSDVSYLCLEAKDGAEVEINIDEAYSPVLTFEYGKDITLRGLTFGHRVEPGYCSGSVLSFESTSEINIENCKLYGSGTYGIETTYCSEMNVSDTDIYECTYGLLSLFGTNYTHFNNCTLRDSSDLDLITTVDCSDIRFENCVFSGNSTDSYFVRRNEYDDITFTNCEFKNNEYKEFSNYEVTLENCKNDKE